MVEYLTVNFLSFSNMTHNIKVIECTIGRKLIFKLLISLHLSKFKTSFVQRQNNMFIILIKHMVRYFKASKVF